MSTHELIAELRENLVPRGGESVVPLFTSGHYQGPAVKEAIDRIEYLLTIGVSMGKKANPLEKIAIEILLEAANLDIDWGQP